MSLDFRIWPLYQLLAKAAMCVYSPLDIGGSRHIVYIHYYPPADSLYRTLKEPIKYIKDI